MQSALLFYCKVPDNIKNIRKEYDKHINLPAHITLGYLKADYDEDKLIKKLKKFKKIKLELNKLYSMSDLIAFSVNNKNINIIAKSIREYIEKYPKSGFHMSLAYKRDKKINKKVYKKIEKNINIPTEIIINKIWIMKRNKSIGKDWYRSKTIFLK